MTTRARGVCTVLMLAMIWLSTSAQNSLSVSEAAANILAHEGRAGGIETTTGCENEPFIHQGTVVEGGLKQQLDGLARIAPSLTWQASENSVRVTIGKASALSLLKVRLPAISIDASSARIAGDEILGQPAVQRMLESSQLRLFTASPGFAKLPKVHRMISLAPASVADDLDYVAGILDSNVWIYSVRDCGQPVGRFTWRR